jgi:hypothetical protein
MMRRRPYELHAFARKRESCRAYTIIPSGNSQPAGYNQTVVAFRLLHDCLFMLFTQPTTKQELIVKLRLHIFPTALAHRKGSGLGPTGRPAKSGMCDDAIRPA